MDYHNDRFEDYSLMVYSKESLIALLPANRVDDVLYSHQGLTYGGIILKANYAIKDLQLIFGSICSFLKEKGIQRMILKTLPSLYIHQPDYGLENALYKHNAQIIHQNLIMAIDYRSNFKIYKSKLKRYRKLDSGKYQIIQGSSEFEPFWNLLLVPRLAEKHNSEPVHSINEILKLHRAFPNKINQFNLYLDDELLAGITIFKTKKVVKSQYGIASVKGEKLGALDMLFVHLIKTFENDGFSYFSMGTINDNSEKGYSEGMLKQKQEFGCERHEQPIYEIALNG